MTEAGPSLGEMVQWERLRLNWRDGCYRGSLSQPDSEWYVFLTPLGDDAEGIVWKAEISVVTAGRPGTWLARTRVNAHHREWKRALGDLRRAWSAHSAGSRLPWL